MEEALAFMTIKAPSGDLFRVGLGLGKHNSTKNYVRLEPLYNGIHRHIFGISITRDRIMAERNLNSRYLIAIVIILIHTHLSINITNHSLINHLSAPTVA